MGEQRHSKMVGGISMEDKGNMWDQRYRLHMWDLERPKTERKGRRIGCKCLKKKDQSDLIERILVPWHENVLE